MRDDSEFCAKLNNTITKLNNCYGVTSNKRKSKKHMKFENLFQSKKHILYLQKMRNVYIVYELDNWRATTTNVFTIQISFLEYSK